MSIFESSSPMALVPLPLPSDTASRLRKTMRNVSYPSPLVLADERFPLDLIPICDDEDDETDCGDINITIHLNFFATLHRFMHRITKQTSSYRPYFASATIFALFFVLIFTVVAFNDSPNPQTNSLFGRQNIPALRHASIDVIAEANARLMDAYSWAAQGGSSEDRYNMRAARAAGIHSPLVAAVPASPSPITDDRVPRVVLSPSGVASAKFRVARATEGTDTPRSAVHEDMHAHPEDLKRLFSGGRRS